MRGLGDAVDARFAAGGGRGKVEFTQAAVGFAEEQRRLLIGAAAPQPAAPQDDLSASDFYLSLTRRAAAPNKRAAEAAPKPPAAKRRCVEKTPAAVQWEIEAAAAAAAAAAPPAPPSRPSHTIVFPVAQQRVGEAGLAGGDEAEEAEEEEEAPAATIEEFLHRQRYPQRCAACGARYRGARKDHEQSVSHILKLVRLGKRASSAAEHVGYFAPRESVAFGLVRSMGWEEGGGLGRELQGRAAPLKAAAHDRKGLGKPQAARRAAAPPAAARTAGGQKRQREAEIRADAAKEARARRMMFETPMREERCPHPRHRHPPPDY